MVAPAPAERAANMAALYRAGYTLTEIGAQYGLTRERVRQVLKAKLGLTGRDGGQTKKAQARRAKAAAARDARSFIKHGCSWQQYIEIRDYARKRKANGAPKRKDPRLAFRSQRHNASARGIGWELTLWQWWSIWQQSGHWDERGRGQGYVMCRVGDEGPYAVGNVFVALAAENSSVQKRKKTDLPCGVQKNKHGPGYVAFRMIDRKNLCLGRSFATPELAHAAYLAAGERISRPASPPDISVAA